MVREPDRQRHVNPEFLMTIECGSVSQISPAWNVYHQAISAMSDSGQCSGSSTITRRAQSGEPLAAAALTL
jgi:hypothetical protein